MREEVRRQGCEPETGEEAGRHRIREERKREGGQEREQGGEAEKGDRQEEMVGVETKRHTE